MLQKQLQIFPNIFLLFSSFSSDPILTAFQLSDELKKLKQMESQFCAEFSELRKQVQEFSTSLLGAKYLGFFSSRSLKTREKYISFAQLDLLSLYIF